MSPQDPPPFHVTTTIPCHPMPRIHLHSISPQDPPPFHITIPCHPTIPPKDPPPFHVNPGSTTIPCHPRIHYHSMSPRIASGSTTIPGPNNFFHVIPEPTIHAIPGSTTIPCHPTRIHNLSMSPHRTHTTLDVKLREDSKGNGSTLITEPVLIVIFVKVKMFDRKGLD